MLRGGPQQRLRNSSATARQMTPIQDPANIPEEATREVDDRKPGPDTREKGDEFQGRYKCLVQASMVF